MSSRKTKEISAALRSKGFQLQESKHHEIYWLWANAKKTSIRTRLSRGKSEYADNLLAQIAKQIKLQRTELDSFIACPLTADLYLQLLVERKYVTLKKGPPATQTDRSKAPRR